MKNLVGISAIFTLTLASFAPVAFASHYQNQSDAHPSEGKFQGATHHLYYQAMQNPLTAMTIQLPEGIQIDGVEIEDQSGKPLTAKVKINEEKVTLIFDQKLPAQTKLSIKLQGVNTPGYGNTWQYKLFGKFEGIEQEIPLGTARLQTYD